MKKTENKVLISVHAFSTDFLANLTHEKDKVYFFLCLVLFVFEVWQVQDFPAVFSSQLMLLSDI